MHYHLSGSLSELNAHGTAQADSIHLNHPFIRNTAGNLYGQLQFDHKQLHDDIDLASIQTNRHTNDIMAVLAGDRRDDHGVSNFNLSASKNQKTGELGSPQRNRTSGLLGQSGTEVISSRNRNHGPSGAGL